MDKFSIVIDVISIILSTTASIIAICVTLYNSKKQNEISSKLGERQNELSELQCNISLFDKRYKIFNKMKDEFGKEFYRLYHEPFSNESIKNWLIINRSEIRLLFSTDIIKQYDIVYDRYNDFICKLSNFNADIEVKRDMITKLNNYHKNDGKISNLEDKEQIEKYLQSVLNIGFYDFLYKIANEISLFR